MESDLRKPICKAARLNAAYMDMPVGRHYPALVRLYRQIAEESVEWARRYEDGVPSARTLREGKLVGGPRASVAAFWWGTVAWAINIGSHMLGDCTKHDWFELFVRPHINFARYLRPEPKDASLTCPQLWDIERGLHPADLILELDRRWMALVKQLTARWGLWSHLRYLPALAQSLRLAKHLRSYYRSAITTHYLRADLAFLRLLFGIFLQDSELWPPVWKFLESAGINHLPVEYAAWAAKMTVELELTGGQGPAE